MFSLFDRRNKIDACNIQFVNQCQNRRFSRPMPDQACPSAIVLRRRQSEMIRNAALHSRRDANGELGSGTPRHGRRCVEGGCHTRLRSTTASAMTLASSYGQGALTKPVGSYAPPSANATWAKWRPNWRRPSSIRALLPVSKPVRSGIAEARRAVAP
jgi:hypothetical protein